MTLIIKDLFKNQIFSPQVVQGGLRDVCLQEVCRTALSSAEWFTGSLLGYSWLASTGVCNYAKMLKADFFIRQIHRVQDANFLPGIFLGKSDLAWPPSALSYLVWRLKPACGRTGTEMEKYNYFTRTQLVPKSFYPTKAHKLSIELPRNFKNHQKITIFLEIVRKGAQLPPKKRNITTIHSFEK